MSSTRLDRIHACLEQIRKKHHGRLTARAVLNAARAKNHPLHNEFVWDDRAAAEKFRMDQARQLIASVEIVVTFAPVKLICPAYTRDPDVPPRQQGHVAITSDQIKLNDARRILELEIVRIAGCVQRARGIALYLARRFPDLPEHLQTLEQSLSEMKSRLTI